MLIETRNSAEPLARTLSGLVGGAIEGIIRDVVILDHGSTDQTHKVADAAGCTFIRDHGLIECIRHARGDWLLILEPGARLLEGWMEGIATHVEHFPGPARFTRAGPGRRRLLPRVFARRAGFTDGLLISRRQAMSLLKKGRTGADLTRGLSTRRLRVEIIPPKKRKTER